MIGMSFREKRFLSRRILRIVWLFLYLRTSWEMIPFAPLSNPRYIRVAITYTSRKFPPSCVRGTLFRSSKRIAKHFNVCDNQFIIARSLSASCFCKNYYRYNYIADIATICR